MQKPTPTLPMASLFGRRAAASMRCANVSAFFGLVAVLGLASYHPSVHAQSPLNNITKIAAGGNHSCALTASGGVKCWGSNGNGELGDGSTTDRVIAIDVSGLSSGREKGSECSFRPLTRLSRPAHLCRSDTARQLAFDRVLEST